jgi:hypothetical protein
MFDDVELIRYDGLDDAIIGVAERINLQPVLAYDTLKVIELLMEQFECDDTDAWEFFEYNILGGWLGEGTPIFITPKEYLDLDI